MLAKLSCFHLCTLTATAIRHKHCGATGDLLFSPWLFNTQLQWLSNLVVGVDFRGNMGWKIRPPIVLGRLGNLLLVLRTNEETVVESSSCRISQKSDHVTWRLGCHVTMHVKRVCQLFPSFCVCQWRVTVITSTSRQWLQIAIYMRDVVVSLLACHAEWQ